MGKGCKHHPIHQKSTFLPMFCRSSIKDVALNHTKDRSDDPSSPKVSCMGQVKRNNRVIGFPTTATASSSSAVTRTINHHPHPHNYTKLKKLFSSTKTLMPTTATITNGTAAAAAAASSSFGGRSGSKSCRSSREMSHLSSYNKRTQMKSLNDRDDDHNGDQDCVKAVINISEMDPPLPVVKRVAPPGVVGNDEVNIWKRRFNGVSLTRLQIEEIQLSNNKFLPPTTV